MNAQAGDVVEFAPRSITQVGAESGGPRNCVVAGGEAVAGARERHVVRKAVMVIEWPCIEGGLSKCQRGMIGAHLVGTALSSCLHPRSSRRGERHRCRASARGDREGEEGVRGGRAAGAFRRAFAPLACPASFGGAERNFRSALEGGGLESKDKFEPCVQGRTHMDECVSCEPRCSAGVCVCVLHRAEVSVASSPGRSSATLVLSHVEKGQVYRVDPGADVVHPWHSNIEVEALQSEVEASRRGMTRVHALWAEASLEDTRHATHETHSMMWGAQAHAASLRAAPSVAEAHRLTACQASQHRAEGVHTRFVVCVFVGSLRPSAPERGSRAEGVGGATLTGALALHLARRPRGSQTRGLCVESFVCAHAVLASALRACMHAYMCIRACSHTGICACL